MKNVPLTGARWRRHVMVLALGCCAPAFAQLATTTATLQELPEMRSFAGRVDAVREATVSAETSGRVEEIRADIGDMIAAGTVILTVSSEGQRAGLTRAEAALAEANAALTAETAEFQRVRDLAAQRFASPAELDRAAMRLDTATARVTGAEAALRAAREQLAYTEVRAPYGGVVSARYVEPGEMVQPGTRLMSGYDPSALRVEIDLPQAVAGQVRDLGEALVATGDGDPGLRPEKLLLYPAADNATGTVRARLELPAAAQMLYPGQLVSVQFTIGTRTRLLIPQASVVQRSEVTAVYVVSDGVPGLRQVRTGIRSGDQVEVLAGLSAGEQVATDPVAAAALAGGRGAR